jgi:hypothetical protein
MSMKIADAARRHPPPKTPIPIPAFAPLDKLEDEAAAWNGGISAVVDGLLLLINGLLLLIDVVKLSLLIAVEIILPAVVKGFEGWLECAVAEAFAPDFVDDTEGWFPLMRTMAVGGERNVVN